MFTGAETQAWIQHNDCLVLSRSPIAPTGLDQQSQPDFDRAEMASPSFCPIDRPEFPDSDSDWASAKPARFNLIELTYQGLPPRCIPCRSFLTEDRDPARPGFFGRVNGRWARKHTLHHLADCVFSLVGDGQCDLPERSRIHAKSRQGVKLST
jgi:hypothetical protein